MELLIYLDLACKSNSLKNAQKKFYNIGFIIVDVVHHSGNLYIGESTITLEDDEIKKLNLINDNVKDFNFYDYIENKIPLKSLRTKKNKTGVFVSHLELKENLHGGFLTDNMQ